MKVMKLDEKVIETMVEILGEVSERYNVNTLNVSTGASTHYAPTPGREYGCAIFELLTDEQKQYVRVKRHYCDTFLSDAKLLYYHLVAHEMPMAERLIGVPLYFLVELQMLHDQKENWNEQGLSERGLREVDRLAQYVRGSFKVMIESEKVREIYLN